MNPGLLALGIAVVALGAGACWYERARLSSKEIPILVVLAAVAALGRVPFAAIPSVQPTTFFVMISGLVFGPLAGIVVGASAAFGSNIFLGQGPWTPWQMLAWALCGASCGIASNIRPARQMTLLLVMGVLWGYLFGWLMNFWYWISFVYPLTIRSWLATTIASCWFDTLHAIGNVCFVVLCGPSCLRMLGHFRQRLTITYQETGGR